VRNGRLGFPLDRLLKLGDREVPDGVDGGERSFLEEEEPLSINEVLETVQGERRAIGFEVGLAYWVAVSGCQNGRAVHLTDEALFRFGEGHMIFLSLGER